MSGKPPNHWRAILVRANPGMLYAEDIGPSGTTVDVEIKESGVCKVRGPDGTKEMPWIGTGRPGGKKLGCNATNCKALETLCGTADYLQWRGWITLVVIRTEYTDSKLKQRFETDAIRISPQRPRRKSGTEPPIDSKVEPPVEPSQRETPEGAP